MQRRQRVDSATAAVAIMTASTDEILPPAHSPLPDGAMPFWREIARGRARDEWESAPALLSTAASLAWVQWRIARLRGMIDGTVDIEPGIKEAALASHMIELQRLEMAYLRTLQQHGRAVGGEARDVGKRRAATAQIEADNPMGNDLLARPPASIQ